MLKTEIPRPIKGSCVLTQGFLVNVDVPSEERMSVKVDISSLSNTGHMSWVSRLQNMLQQIDVDYKTLATGKNVTNTRRRSIKARYVKNQQGQQIKIVSFQPYPSLLINRLKSIRHMVYDILNENCLIIQEEQIGRMKRKLYFLPANSAAEVMNKIGELNSKLNTLKIEIANYEKSSYFNDVVTYIKSVDKNQMASNVLLPEIKIAPIPLSLSKSFFLNYLQEEKRKAIQEVDEKKKEGLAALEREIQQKRQEMLEAMSKDLQDRFATILALVEQVVKDAFKRRTSALNSKTAAKRLNSLTQLIKNAGIEFDTKSFDAVSNVLNVAGKNDLLTLKNAVNELVQSLGMSPTGDPIRDMELARKTAQGNSILLFTVE
ncbi:MAG: Atg14 domain-containing protein [Candidatus Bathyarchaeota archaeon]|nr:Atg14 domain-containing protein [Candidatus Bathyarchaeota archaeon]